jgi:hypothetical protein
MTSVRETQFKNHWFKVVCLVLNLLLTYKWSMSGHCGQLLREVQEEDADDSRCAPVQQNFLTGCGWQPECG